MSATNKDSGKELCNCTNKHKLVFLGEQSVGKTSLITKFMYGTFDQMYQATIGVDFLSKTMYVENRTVRLQLWDTAGQERFRCLISNYIRNSSVAIMVFDITSEESFKALDRWVREARESNDKLPIVLIGNKCDLDDRRAVSKSEAESKAKSFNAHYYETSAKDGTSVRQVFRDIACRIPTDNSDSKSKKNAVEVKLRNSGNWQEDKRTFENCYC